MTEVVFDYIASNGVSAKIRVLPGAPTLVQVQLPQLNGPDMIIEESVHAEGTIDLRAVGVRMIEEYLGS